MTRTMLIVLVLWAGVAKAETLTWTAQPAVSSYKVYHRLSTESDYGPGALTGANATYPTGVLAPGTHVFAVTALDAAGKESAKSAEVFKVVLPPPDPRLSILTTLCKAFGGTAC